MTALLPSARQAFVDPRSGLATPAFYEFLRGLLTSTDGAATAEQIRQIALALGSPDGTVGNIPEITLTDVLTTATQVLGQQSIASFGTLANGVVALQLVNDQASPPPTAYYGTDDTGARGYVPVFDAFATAEGIGLAADPVTGIVTIAPDDDLEAIEALSGQGIAVRTGTDVWALRTIAAGAGIAVTEGAGTAGNPTIAHADTSSVADLTSDNSDAVAIQDIAVTFDTFGHVQTISVGTVNMATALATTFQPLDATLTALAGLTVAANQGIYATGVDAFATYTLTPYARTLLDDADAATARSTLGAEGAIPSGTTGQFWRGDKTFSNTLVGDFTAQRTYATQLHANKTSTPLGGGTTNQPVFGRCADNIESGIAVFCSITSGSAIARGANFETYTTRGSAAAQTGLLTDDHFGGLISYGHNGTAVEIGGRLGWQARDTWTSASMPSRAFFQTIPSGSNSPVSRVYIEPDGSMIVNPATGNTETSANGRLQVNVSANGGVLPAARLANVFGTNGSGVALSFDPGGFGYNVRDAQIVATNNGGNSIAMTFRLANGAAPAEVMRLTPSGGLGLGGNSLGGSVGAAIFIANATTAPTSNPAGGGILYVEGGALKFRGSGGTVTTIGPA